MKKFSWPLAHFVFLLFIFLLLPGLIHAQPDPDCGPDYPCPIDGGLVALIAIGVGYGVKKIRVQRKAKSDF